ncbi:MAG TPA: alpha/beta hydrolase-fold protein [Chitinophagaceae bacterium]|jgi:alpha-glucosidase|nr:alpha/beta hydrolase-fold protein [Chitinophagaceae bacterium]
MIKRVFISLFFLVTVLLAFSQHTVRFTISSFPTSNTSDSSLFVAGSFNGWNPQDKNYRFQKDAIGNYFVETKLADGMHEFKITRGSWSKVECRKNGVDIPNRFFRLSSDTTINLAIEEWADRFVRKPRVSTASKNVHIIDTAFIIPQLNRVRRVWIYLPPSYATSQKHYPVLYMHDGQNVFDDSTSFAGEWGVDEILDSISGRKKEIIVVAIDHGGVKRTNEYCPYDMERFGRGEGDQYLDFLVKTLKPFIDKNYRTEKNKQNTFIAGSSMGGLISMYAVLKYPKIFGGAGVFSPAFWIAPKIFDDIKTKGKKVNSKIYFYCGKQESESMEPDMVKVFEEMRKVSKSKMITSVRPDGKHTEWVWREEFPLFYLWIINPHPPKGGLRKNFDDFYIKLR